MTSPAEFFKVLLTFFAPPYFLPVIGGFISTRFWARHWWPNLPDLILMIVPFGFFMTLTLIEDRQGFNLGLPEALLALPVIVCLWLAPDVEWWITGRQAAGFLVELGACLAAVLAVYWFYPHGSLHF